MFLCPFQQHDIWLVHGFANPSILDHQVILLHQAQSISESHDSLCLRGDIWGGLCAILSQNICPSHLCIHLCQSRKIEDHLLSLPSKACHTWTLWTKSSWMPLEGRGESSLSNIINPYDVVEVVDDGRQPVTDLNTRRWLCSIIINPLFNK